MSLRKRAGLELLRFMASSGLFQASRLAVLVVAAGQLGPEQFGLWNLVVVLQSYTTHATFGLLSGANRRIPLFLGAGSPADARRTERVAVAGAVAAGLVLALVAATAGIGAGVAGPVAVGVGLLLLTQQLHLAGQVILRGNLQFDRASAQQAILAVVLPSIAVPGVMIWGILGLAVGHAVAYALGFALVVAWHREVRPGLDRTLTTLLLREGAPIMVSGLAFAVVMSVDRWALVTFGTRHELGEYALASTVAAGLLFVNLVVAQQLYPRMAHAYGASHGDVQSIVGLAKRQGLLAGGIAVSIAAPVIVLAPSIVPVVLPAYVGSITALQVLAVAYAVLAFASGFMNLLVTIGGAFRLIIVQGLAGVTAGSLAVAALTRGLGPAGVALAVLVGVVVLAIGAWTLARAVQMTARPA